MKVNELQRECYYKSDEKLLKEKSYHQCNVKHF